MTHTVTDIVTFILRNRHDGRAFNHGESAQELEEILRVATHASLLVVDSDWFGRIRGVIVGEIRDDSIHILGLLTVSHVSIGLFASWLLDCTIHRGYSISATRRGRAIRYDTKKLLTKLIRRNLIWANQ